MKLNCRVCTDDADLPDEQPGRSWEQQKQRIKAIEDKYRWKLNERGVCISNLSVIHSRIYNSKEVSNRDD